MYNFNHLLRTNKHIIPDWRFLYIDYIYLYNVKGKLLFIIIWNSMEFSDFTMCSIGKYMSIKVYDTHLDEWTILH